jgi:hypothetical protein
MRMNRDEDDWRLHGQDTYLMAVTLFWKEYHSPRPDWDHDHCEFCWAVFAETEGAQILHEGYATQDNYWWICATCAREFKGRFRWTCVGGPLGDATGQSSMGTV